MIIQYVFLSHLKLRLCLNRVKYIYPLTISLSSFIRSSANAAHISHIYPRSREQILPKTTVIHVYSFILGYNAGVILRLTGYSATAEFNFVHIQIYWKMLFVSIIMWQVARWVKRLNRQNWSRKSLALSWGYSLSVGTSPECYTIHSLFYVYVV